MPRKTTKPAPGIYSARPGCLLITVNVREITFRDTVRAIYTRALVDHPSPSLIILDLGNVLFLSRAACDELLSFQDYDKSVREPTASAVG